MEKNKINVTDRAIANIVKISVKEIDGVVRLCDKHEKNLQSFFKQKKDNSIQLSHNDQEGVEIEIELVAKYGISIQNLALKIQEKVSSELKNMLDIEAESINIIIKSVE